MAKNTKPDLSKEMKMLEMSREERRKAQRKQLMELGLKRREAAQKGKY